MLLMLLALLMMNLLQSVFDRVRKCEHVIGGIKYVNGKVLYGG